MKEDCSDRQKDWSIHDFEELVPEWKGNIVQVNTLTGGITNKLFRVELACGTAYVVRIFGERTELFIDRAIEAENIRRLQRTGVVPELFGFMPERNVTIVEYIPGSPLSNSDFLREELHEPVIKTIKAIHHSGIILPKLFHPLVEIKRLWQVLCKFDQSYPEFDIPTIIKTLERLFDLTEISETDYLPCHNDLLADNFIVTSDSQNPNKQIALIDWEYAGMNTVYYEISDMFQEILVPREIEDNLLRIYWDGHDLENQRRLVDIFKPFPDVYWFLWSLIQLQISNIEFDYYEYGRVKLENAKANIEMVRKCYSVSV